MKKLLILGGVVFFVIRFGSYFMMIFSYIAIILFSRMDHSEKTQTLIQKHDAIMFRLFDSFLKNALSQLNSLIIYLFVGLLLLLNIVLIFMITKKKAQPQQTK